MKDMKQIATGTSVGRLFLLPVVLSVFFALCVCNNASAQQKTDVLEASGIVVDENRQPVIGAAVFVEGTSVGTTTDLDGKFNIEVPSDANVTVQLIGYKVQTFPADELDGMTVVLVQDTNLLDDVVVVGYGVRKKETLTGAISQISNDAIMTTTNSSLAQNLSGKIAGLQIRQNSGEPGDFNTTINVRGFGNPLYVIDGIPQDLGGNDFQRLNPKDIESISIIKDASAAIFGLRAANGVVIVTTNRGAKGRTRFSYDGVFGIQTPTDMPRMANRAEWAQMRNDANINAGSAPMFTPEQLAFEMTAPSTDWYDLTMKKFAIQQQHNISASGGNDKVTYYMSLGYVDENGLLRSGDLNYNKYSFRVNLSAKLTRNFTADASVSGRFDTKNSPSSGFHNIFYGTRTALPNSPAYANDNPDYLAYQRFLHPLALAESDISGYTQDKNDLLSSTLTLTYDFPYLKGLKLKGTVSYSNNRISNKTLVKSYNLYEYDAMAEIPYKVVSVQNSPSKISNSFSNIGMLTLQAQAVYTRTFAKYHDIDATLVYEQHKYDSRVASLEREYSFYTNDQINQASLNNMKNSGMEDEQATMSLIGRFNYAYKSKYLVEFAFRNDGSYRYHPDRRWGFFPVASIGWRISEEPFMKSVEFISNLKLRGSFGVVGEDAGQPFQYIPGYTLEGGGGYEFQNGTWTEGASSPSIVNEYLTWFKSYTSDIGIDLGLFRNRLSLEFDVYQRDRTGLLATRLVSLPNTFGSSLPEENINSDRIRGFDMTVSYNDNWGDFYFGVQGTLNYARSMNLYVEHADYANSMDRWRSGVDYRWNDIMWGYVLDGQFQDEEAIIVAPIQGGVDGNTKILPGDYKYKDMNEDGVIDSKDMMPIFYNGTPKLYYGLTLSASWRNWDFNAVLQGSGCYTVRFKEVYAEILAFDLNTPAYFADRWHLADPYNPDSGWVPGKWPASRLVTDAGSIYYESEIWRRDASYLRLKSLELGYSLPKKWMEKINIDSIRLYFSAHNLFTITDSFVRPFDPEKIEGTNSSGFTYPLMRSFNFGVNINF